MAVFTRRRLTPWMLAFLLLPVTGCWTERVTWSPDGRRAAIVVPGGLYLSDSGGALSPLLEGSVRRAVWLAGSERLLVVQQVRVETFNALACAVGRERALVVAAKAEGIWGQLKAGVDPDHIQTDVDVFGSEAGAIALYLLERHRAELAALSLDDEIAQEDTAVHLHSLSAVRIVGDHLEFGPTLYQDLFRIAAIRPSPDGALIAFVTETDTMLGSRGDLTLFAVPSDGSRPPAMIAEHVAPDVDWTSGHGVVYLSGSEPEQPHVLGALRLANISLTEKGLRVDDEFLATAVFMHDARVRTLADGRLVFSAVDAAFPSTEDHPATDELFVLDRSGREPSISTLLTSEQRRHLQGSLALFEISPDARHVLVPDVGSGILMFSLSNGKTDRIETGLENDPSHHISAPGWRAPDEFSYVKSLRGRPELVLRRNGFDIIVSRGWPDEVVRGLVR